MRLIDADNLIEKVEQYFDGLPIVVHHDMVEFIKNAPTADVQEVVRCKDCKYFDMSDIGGTIPPIVYRCKRFARTYREAEDYCSYAERKEPEDGVH